MKEFYHSHRELSPLAGIAAIPVKRSLPGKVKWIDIRSVAYDKQRACVCSGCSGQEKVSPLGYCQSYQIVCHRGPEFVAGNLHGHVRLWINSLCVPSVWIIQIRSTFCQGLRGNTSTEWDRQARTACGRSNRWSAAERDLPVCDRPYRGPRDARCQAALHQSHPCPRAHRFPACCVWLPLGAPPRPADGSPYSCSVASRFRYSATQRLIGIDVATLARGGQCRELCHFAGIDMACRSCSGSWLNPSSRRRRSSSSAHDDGMHAAAEEAWSSRSGVRGSRGLGTTAGSCSARSRTRMPSGEL